MAEKLALIIGSMILEIWTHTYTHKGSLGDAETRPTTISAEPNVLEVD